MSEVQVAIVIVAYNCRDELHRCLRSVLASGDRAIERHIIVVDNASVDGTPEMIRQDFPMADLLQTGANLGFTGGCNVGWHHARQRYFDTKYLALLNPDTIVGERWLEPLVEWLERNQNVGCVQAKVRLYGSDSLIDTAGNCSHYLGFGLTTGHGQRDIGQFDQPHRIDFASGAAAMVRMDLLDRVGLFDEQFFMYLEDAELGWKLQQLGFNTFYVPQSIVDHEHHFEGTLRHYYYLERNRWWMLLVYYRWPTLLLLTPALVLMELGQWGFAAMHGLLGQKCRSYTFFLNSVHLRRLNRCRQETQKRRLLNDRQFMGQFTGRIDFGPVGSVLIRYIANPILNGYWTIVRRLIYW